MGLIVHLGVGQTKEVRFSGAEVATRRIMYFYFTFVISSLSVGHSRHHVGGPTNWDLA